MSSKVEVTKPVSPQRAAAPSAGDFPMFALRSQMDRLFDDFMSDWRMPSLSRDFLSLAPFGTQASGQGAVDVRFDVSESDEGIEITAELPGIDEKDVEVSLDNGVLQIKGEKKFEKETKKRDYHLSERRYGSFSRAMRLPDSVDQDNIRAGFEKGVLTVMLPKRAEAKAKKKTIRIGKD